MFLGIKKNLKRQKIVKLIIDSFSTTMRSNLRHLSSTTLDLISVQALLLSLGERVNDADLAEMIRMADLDGDGKVSMEDYMTFIKGLQ